MSTVDRSEPVIEVLVNGEARSVTEGATVAAWVASAVGDPRTVAIERNGEIVPRSRWASTVLEPGDRLEVVGFVQGG